MFMLTHTYFLQKFLENHRHHIEKDIFVYNVAPDLLALHPGISSAKTHALSRSMPIHSQYPKSAYVIMHLLVDDLSHYGYICAGDHDEFNIDSKGYSYLKGHDLIDSILNLHKTAGREISLSDAVYQSHLIIEMIYDLVIFSKIDSFKTIDVLIDAIDFTVKNKMEEFVSTMNWLYGLERHEINDVMKSILLFITKESMQGIMNIEGRMNLYRGKFGLRNNEKIFYDCLKDLFHHAVDLIDDDEILFQEASQLIKKDRRFPFPT